MSGEAPDPIQALRQKILEEHQSLPHPGVAKQAMRAHLLIHELIEKQLLAGDPPEVRGVLERLISEGLSRHQAVHAMGSVMAKEAYLMMRDKRPLDREAYLGQLETLHAESVREDDPA